jgi:hypothetical protein
MESFNQFVFSQGGDTVRAANMDEMMVAYFNHLYFSGHRPSKGERTLAALMMTDPSYALRGTLRVPRAWRALKGWQRLTPVVSRKPLPWPFWTFLAEEMVRSGRTSMGVFTVLCVSAYMRPSELMSVRRCDMIPPCRGVLAHWSMVLFPEEVGRPSKTMKFNDSICLDDAKLAGMGPIFQIMTHVSSKASLWSFEYPEHTKVFCQMTKQMGYAATPYQMRHSGPSIDLANRSRSLEEAQNRGRWAVASSMVRYGRHSRLAAEWMKVPLRTRQRADASVGRVVDTLLGRSRR